jgi:hypothetical protein
MCKVLTLHFCACLLQHRLRDLRQAHACELDGKNTEILELKVRDEFALQVANRGCSSWRCLECRIKCET